MHALDFVFLFLSFIPTLVLFEFIEGHILCQSKHITSKLTSQQKW